MTTSLTHQQQQQKITKIFEEQIENKNHCLFSTVNQRLHMQQQQFTNTSINILQTLQQQIAKCAIRLKCQHKQLQLLCFVTYRQNNQFHTYYDVAHSVEQLLRRRKMNDDCGKITQLYVQFICVYVKSLYQFDQIIQTVLGYTREMYEKGVESHVGRNLTLIPPNAIMKDGRMYCQHEPQQFEGMDMDQNLMEKVRQALKAKGKLTVKSNQQQNNMLGSKNVNTVKDSKQQQSKPSKQSKQNITQPQRITDTKKPSKNEQNKRPQHQQQQPQTQTHHHTQKLQKKSLPNKKLLIESQSEQYYKPGKQIPMFDLKQRQTMPSQQQHHQHHSLQSQRMQLQNQGNYLQNQHNKNGNNNINNKIQKMEIQQQNNNNKDGSDDEQDSMMMFMNQMKKTDEVNGRRSVNNNNNNNIKNNNNINSKPSIGAKSMPAATGKQSASSISTTNNNNSKLNEFCSKFTQPPSKTNQPVKQASLFTFLGKKK